MNSKKGYFLGLISGVAIIISFVFVLNSFMPNILSVNSDLIGYRNISASNLPEGSSDEPGYVKTSGKTKSNIEIEKKISEIYNILDTRYVGEYDRQETVEAMYQGLVYGVGDPYTSYMDKDTFEDFMQDTDGSFAGIGVVVSVDKTDNKIVVVSPFEGCPGEKAGILPKDKIIKVNDYDVFGDQLDTAIKMMKGVPGTNVKVTIYRESTKETLDFDIKRDNIEVPTVSHKMIDTDIGYIKISQFSRITDTQYSEALADLKANNMKGLIIDLRNNPGGLLDVVCKITDTLVPEGTIVYTEDKKGSKKYTKSDKNHLDLPLLILVNGNSASASEVLAGAVKDYGVGELIGTQTYGKGLVQNIFTMKDGSAVKVTIAKYYTPSGVCIQGEGIEPNYKVEMSDVSTASISSLDTEEDVQLKTAVTIMTGKIISN